MPMGDHACWQQSWLRATVPAGGSPLWAGREWSPLRAALALCGGPYGAPSHRDLAKADHPCKWPGHGWPPL
ncbi:hypothetical protein GW17_00061335, partial [Ensete ventricosum]